MSAIDYSGKVVIITGSSSGIGQAAAVLFGKAGASVTIHGRSEAGLKKTADLLQKAGVPEERIHFVRGAVTDPTVQKALIEETASKFGRIDILINNAGGMNNAETNQRSMSAFDYTIDVNLKAPIALVELAIPYLEKTKGSIINVGSASSQMTFPMIPFYCISKAALDHFTRNYAAILAPKGIRINNLNPGYTDTPMLSGNSGSEEETQQVKNSCLIGIPLKRLGTSEEMAELLVFMASEKASYLTGQIIFLEGGLLINSLS